MSAYVIVDVTVHDTERYADYRRMVPSTLEPYGGRFLARGGETRVLEGDWIPGRLVILEFPDRESAVAWLESSEYQDARALRHATATSRMVMVEGV